MMDYEFISGTAKDFKVRVDNSTLYIDSCDNIPNITDYSDAESVKILATKAVNTANGFYDLVINNCEIESPNLSTNAHLEMFLALAGFACEIYLKSIIYNEKINNDKLVKGHRLDELFKLIPEECKEEIRKEISDIDREFSVIGDIFTTLRYDFELNHIKGNYLIVFKLMEILKTMSNRYDKKNVGSIRYANGCLSFESLTNNKSR